MRSRYLFSIMAIALVALAAMLLLRQSPVATAQPAPAGQWPPTRVAVANISRIINGQQEAKVIHERLETEGKELAGREQQMRQELSALINQRKNINRNHPSWEDVTRQIDAKNAQIQVWGMTTKAAVDHETKEIHKKLHEKMEAAIAEIAQKNGIDLVVADNRIDLDQPALEDAPAAEIVRNLNSRTVLYSTKAIDITEQIITLLDLKYSKEGGAGGGPLPR